MTVEPINEVCCDVCGKTFEQKNKDTLEREEKWGKQLCGSCIKVEMGKNISEIGAKILKSFSKEDKKKYCSDAGKISYLKSPKNSGRFSTERWNQLSKEEQAARVKKAADAFQEKMKSDENFKRSVFQKVFKNSTIGFISKGHDELHAFLVDYGFKQHFQILSMQVDECNEDLKIVVEYNGDMYHCNPRQWKPDDFNKVIKMRAKEKWACDRNRFFKLKRLGYRVFVVWETDWMKNRDETKEKLINFIKKIKNETNQN